MSDNVRRYRAIREALNRLYPKTPQGNLARHMNTLAGLTSGIVGSQRTNLPLIASHVPDGTHPDSRGKRFSHWINNKDVEAAVYCLPFAVPLLRSLSVPSA